jgi:hypothetical protein
MTRQRHNPRAQASLIVFSLTLFVSAAITFAVQPMTGKMLLPIVGGTPASWIVAMAFYQVMLLAGYLVAHLLSALSPRRHGALYIVGLAAGTIFLPIDLSRYLDLLPNTPGPAHVFGVLTIAEGIPFIVLSASSSTIQRLFTTTAHASSKDPYFLYGASNLGSFAGLIVYPLFMEPLLTLPWQAYTILYAYVFLILLGFGCLLLSWNRPDTSVAAENFRANISEDARTQDTPAQYLRWLALAFIPSSLLMSVTTSISMDVVSAPMIWVLPLALYLLTFVLTFGRKPTAPLSVIQRVHPYGVFVAVALIGPLHMKWLDSWIGVLFYLAALVIVALMCHSELATLRPADEHLTSFYLFIALGGAVGGVVNAFVVPNVFDSLIECPLTLLASLMLHPSFRVRSRPGIVFVVLLIVSVLIADGAPLRVQLNLTTLRVLIISAILLLAILSAAFTPMLDTGYVAPAAVVLLLIGQMLIVDAAQVSRRRNFYGTIRIYDNTLKVGGREYTARYMQHGTTLHGLQIRARQYETVPTSYYIRSGPLGSVFEMVRPKRVAVIGLGTGATSCYTAPAREFTFFEIDPSVVDLATTAFTFLRECTNGKLPRILLGDGRLELGKLQGETFDLVIIDVFTSDSIPAHVITREALALYASHLNDRGVLAIHISNRFFALWNPIASTSATLGLKSRVVFERSVDESERTYGTPSVWMVIARPGVSFDGTNGHWHRDIKPDVRAKPWTDDYTNVLGTFSFNVVESLLAIDPAGEAAERYPER